MLPAARAGDAFWAIPIIGPSTDRSHRGHAAQLLVCAIEAPSALEQRHRIGIDHVMLETDYPHQDGAWPDTHDLLYDQVGLPNM